MEGKLFLILNLLKDTKEYITASEIAEAIGISVRTVMRYMNLLYNSDETSFRIVSSKTKGYHLEILDANQFAIYQQLQKQRISLTTYQLKILLYIGLSKEITYHELEEKYNYSTSSISRSIHSINEIISKKEIQIENRKNHLHLVGNEIKIRNLLSLLLVNDQNLWNYWKSHFINYIESYRIILKKQSLVLEEPVNFIYLIVSLIRYVNGFKVTLNEMIKIIYSYYDDLNNQVQVICDELKKRLNIDLDDDECLFILLIIMKPENKITDYNYLCSYIQPMIRESLEEIDFKHCSEFTSDEELLDSLSYHIASCLENYILLNNVDNELLEQIKINFTNEYCYAIELKELLYLKMNVEIGDADIGYIALHFARSIEKNKTKTLISARILYQKNSTVAKLLKSRIEEKCPDIRIDSILKCSTLPDDLQNYDFNFVFENNYGYSQYLCTITPFLNYQDLDKINQLIIRNRGQAPLLKMIEESNFISNFDVETKEDCLDKLLSLLISKKLLSKLESEKLLERERLTSTEIVSNVAFPHILIQGNSFLYIAILKQPILWKTTHIKVVLLMGLNEKDRNDQNAIKYLFNRLKDVETLSVIGKVDTFEEFLNILKGDSIC